MKNLDLPTSFKSGVEFEGELLFTGEAAIRTYVLAVLKDCVTALNGRRHFKVPLVVYDQTCLYGLFPDFFFLHLLGHVGGHER